MLELFLWGCYSFQLKSAKILIINSPQSHKKTVFDSTKHPRFSLAENS